MTNRLKHCCNFVALQEKVVDGVRWLQMSRGWVRYAELEDGESGVARGRHKIQVTLDCRTGIKRGATTPPLTRIKAEPTNDDPEEDEPDWPPMVELGKSKRARLAEAVPLRAFDDVKAEPVDDPECGLGVVALPTDVPPPPSNVSLDAPRLDLVLREEVLQTISPDEIVQALQVLQDRSSPEEQQELRNGILAVLLKSRSDRDLMNDVFDVKDRAAKESERALAGNRVSGQLCVADN
jgi:hypothetical protein